jgi:serine/threonine protein kinase
MTQELASLSVGTLLRERYLIKNVLGAESGGRIYLAKDQQVRSLKYSLCILKEIAGLDQETRYQFTVSGATLLRQIRHPALPRIHAVFNDDKRGCIYLVMDYIEGSDLETLRLQQPAGCFSWSELQPLCEPLFAALSYLHGQEEPLVHGNIKPTSILRSITGKVLLVDLGYAQATTPETRKATLATHSSSYLAPEQFEGKIDKRSDIYGLGATLYTLLTGHTPEDAHIRLARVNRRKSDPLPLASSVTPDVPRLLAEVLQKALALNPSERFASVREFWQALTMFTIGDNVPAQALARPATPIPLPASALGIAALPTLVKNPPDAQSARVAEPSHPVPPRRALLPGVTILCVLLLILIGLGTWAWATTHGQTTPFPPNQSGTPANTRSTSTIGEPTPTSVSGPYLSMLGRYTGALTNWNTNIKVASITYTLVITHQDYDKISGTFNSIEYQNAYFIGQIDRQVDIQFTVMDASGNAIFLFNGGSNNVPGETKNTTLGGVFYSCLPDHGATCLQDPNAISGIWNLTYSPVSVAPSAAGWS